MRLIGIATIIMVVVALLTPAVGAQEIENGNYVVTPGETTFKERLLLTSTNVGGIVMPMNAGSIKQGGSDLYSFNVPVGTTERTVDLNWGNPSNSLRLTIFTPIATLGPYYDSADGTVNGRICLNIKHSSGALHPGTWYFEVYGDRVTGTQGYTFVWW
ncbi:MULTISPECIES: PPC domain-containing protein [unclassified Methanoculleus]|jgi:hypothetical protein|uniref:PPC domain-containing protein n=1 Tax=unclassified Methanoculleus TaxID=2619537 RepID=UPI0025D1C381|nr:PPC domain-containing protein [Methanoculleus sp.]